jgi:hypothetical protein
VILILGGVVARAFLRPEPRRDASDGTTEASDRTSLSGAESMVGIEPVTRPGLPGPRNSEAASAA